jgi:hypothetical protein
MGNDRGSGTERGSSKTRPPRRPTPPWLYDRPDDLATTKQHNGKVWYFCTTCNDGKGQWSTTHGNTHPTKKHQPNYKPPNKKRSHDGNNDSSDQPAKKTRVEARIGQLNQLSAKLSLTKKVNSLSSGSDGSFGAGIL